MQAGVIDPTKVVRSALQNAASIASLLLTTEALICEIPEEKKEAGAPAGGGGMGGMDQGPPPQVAIGRFSGLSAHRTPVPQPFFLACRCAPPPSGAGLGAENIGF